MGPDGQSDTNVTTTTVAMLQMILQRRLFAAVCGGSRRCQRRWLDKASAERSKFR
jgi:hypothetical protein